jgi:hypothetical protein
LGLAVLAAMASAAVWLRWDLDTAVGVGGVLSLSATVAALWLAWSAFASDRAEAAEPGPDLAGVADLLAEAVRRQWEDEAALRQLNDPYPLPVRWEPADPPQAVAWPALVGLASSGAGWPRADPAGWASGPAELAGGGADLVEVLGRVPTGRLVVLGEPGSGKTMLAARLVLDLISRRPAGGAVPVLLPLASWNPANQDLHGWLVARLSVDHPGLIVRVSDGAGRTRGRALLDAGLVLPVLDGLDEIPAAVRGAAIARVNDALRPGWRVVLTSRSDCYRHAIAPPDGPQVRLTGAAAVELQPVGGDDIAAYLRADAGSPADAARWDPVVSVLASTEPHPVAAALTTPLMVGLARTIFSPRPGEHVGAVPDPAILCDQQRFPTRADVERHLFDAFIPAAYRPHPDPARRCPWAAQDARRWLAFLACHLEYTIGSTDLRWWELHRRVPLLDRRLVAAPAAGAAGGLAAGLVNGLSFGLTISFWAGPVIGMTVGLIVGLAAGLSFGLTAGLIAGLRGIFAPQPAQGFRWRPHIGSLPNGLVVGLAAGTIVGLLVDPAAGLAAGLAVGLISGLSAGLTWVPADLASGTSPATVLARDRRAFRTQLVTGGLVAGPTVGLTLGFAHGPAVGLAEDGVNALIVGLVLGLVGGVVGGRRSGFGGGLFEDASDLFFIARSWFVLRGMLPRRLMAFLADAHIRRGILRQVGAVYQFRHIELQRHLAGHRTNGAGS